MSLWGLNWLELAVATPLVGAGFVGLIRDPQRAARWGMVVTAVALACSLLSAAGVAQQAPTMSAQKSLFGRDLVAADELGAPIIVTVALLHFLTLLATARVKMGRFSLSWSLVAESIRFATFGTKDSWLLISLLSAGTLTSFVELQSRGRSTRIFIWHMALFVGLLFLGQVFSLSD